jgi:hypothetical protein
VPAQETPFEKNDIRGCFRRDGSRASAQVEGKKPVHGLRYQFRTVQDERPGLYCEVQHALQSLSQLQPHAQATPTQLAMENARLARVALAKATRIAQERTQEEAQEANRIKQDATADSRKAKKEERYRATMEKLGKPPPCPKLSGGEECSGTPCDEEGQGFSYDEHMGDLVVCQDKAHLSMATTDGCLLFHAWAPRKRTPKPPAKTQHPLKNVGGGNLGRKATPQEQRQLESVGEATSGRKGVSAAAAAARRGSPAVRDREAEPRAGGREDQCGRKDARDVIGEFREGSLHVTAPPLPLPPLPPPPPLQPAPEDLERRQAVDRLFTLYESLHIQMMEIRALLRK